MSKIISASAPLAPRWELVFFGINCGGDPIYYVRPGVGYCRTHDRMLTVPLLQRVLAQPRTEDLTAPTTEEKGDSP